MQDKNPNREERTESTDDGLPLVYYDEDGDPHPGIVRVRIEARVERDWTDITDAPGYHELQRRVAEAFIDAADTHEHDPADTGYAGHDDDGLALVEPFGQRWAFPRDAVEAFGAASDAQADDERGGR